MSVFLREKKRNPIRAAGQGEEKRDGATPKERKPPLPSPSAAAAGGHSKFKRGAQLAPLTPAPSPARR